MVAFILTTCTNHTSECQCSATAVRLPHTRLDVGPPLLLGKQPVVVGVELRGKNKHTTRHEQQVDGQVKSSRVVNKKTDAESEMR